MSEVAQSCPTLCDPMDCSPSGSSVHGIFQARILESVSISFSQNVIRLCKGGKSYLINGDETSIILQKDKMRLSYNTK